MIGIGGVNKEKVIVGPRSLRDGIRNFYPALFVDCGEEIESGEARAQQNCSTTSQQ